MPNLIYTTPKQIARLRRIEALKEALGCALVGIVIAIGFFLLTK